MNFCTLLKKKAPFLLLIAYSLFLFSPNWLIVKNIIQPTTSFSTEHIETTEAIFFGAILYLLLFCAFKKCYLTILVTLPFTLLIPFEILHIIRYQAISDSHIYGVIAETNFSEASSYLEGDLGWLTLAFFSAIFFGSSTIYLTYKAKLTWQHRNRWYALTFGTTIWCGYFGLFKIEPNISMPLAQAQGTTEQQISSAEMPYVLQVLKPGYPFGLISRMYYFGQERQALSQADNELKNFNFNATSLENRKTEEIYVLVIGESSRRDRWSINGYTRDTTPLLSKRIDIVSLRNIISTRNSTRTSVPVILTRRPATLLSDFFPERSIITAFNESGYNTWWLSTQQSIGTHDTIISLFANESHTVKHLNPSGYNSKSEYDEVLIPALENALNQPAPKKFIILHTMGSHNRYIDRVPPRYRRFKPDMDDTPEATLFSNNKSFAANVAINNSYDDTIIYTDYILNRIIETLEKTGKKSSLIYISDHGQDLPDGGPCMFRGHGNTSRYNFEIPAVLWFSKQYKIEQPNKVSSAKKNINKRLTTENVFSTLLDIASINIPGMDRDRSIVNADLKEQARIVNAFGLLDFDKAKRSKACQSLVKNE